jgi:hypothetical protein
MLLDNTIKQNLINAGEYFQGFTGLRDQQELKVMDYADDKIQDYRMHMLQDNWVQVIYQRKTYI